jgi:hypothetical protein
VIVVDDPQQTITGAYDPQSMPTSYVIDCKGIVRSVFTTSQAAPAIDKAARGLASRCP